MANIVGIYKHVWHPEDIGIVEAKQLILPLGLAVTRLEQEPEYYKQFEAKNGWGLYIHFVPWLKKYLNACRKYPHAEISVSR